MAETPMMEKLRVFRAEMGHKLQAQRKTIRIFALPASVAGIVAVMQVAQPVQAGDLNTSIYPILTDITDLFAPLLTMIIAAVPLIIALAVVGFILGILDGVLAKLKV